MTDRVIDELNRITLEKHAWLLRAGPIARRLNAEADRETISREREDGERSPEQSR